METKEKRYKLKIDSKNQVTITRCKESWNREELYSIMQQYHDKCVWTGYVTPMDYIKENL